MNSPTVTNIVRRDKMLTDQRIDELINGIDNYLQKLYSFSENLREIKLTLQEQRHSQEKTYMCELEKMRIELKTMRYELQKRGLPEISEYESNFRELKEMVMTEAWPRAVDPKAIIVSEDAAFNRAHHILDLIIGESLTHKSFLDFGCGAGHVVMHSLTQNPKFALGYDIRPSNIKFDNEYFTSEFDFVTLNGPYDVVLMQDVLDHIEYSDPVTVLKQIKSVMDSNGKLFIRNHPWCSRHGSHLYNKLNKAYAHLVFDESELSRMGGYCNDHTLKIIDPIESYRNWFSEVGFKICSEIPYSKSTDEYFKNNGMLREKMLSHWDGDSVRMMKDIQLEFVEYVLEPISDKVII